MILVSLRQGCHDSSNQLMQPCPITTSSQQQNLTYFSVNKVDVDDMISTFNNGKSIVVTKHASDAIKKLEILKFVIKALKIHFIHHLEHKIGFAFLDVFGNDAIASHSIIGLRKLSMHSQIGTIKNG